MSSGGDVPTIVIGGPEASAAEAVLGALRSIVSALEQRGRRAVLIGGIAVMARVALAERATRDLDAAVDVPVEDEPTVALLDRAGVGRALGPPAPQRIDVDGVPVDVIDTYPVLDSLDELPPRDALFVGGHRFAVETAELVELAVGAVRVRAHLARSSGLVATKLHAVLSRRVGAQDKRASDVFDLYRALQAADWRTASVELSSVVVLGRLVADGVESALVDDATRAARHLAISGVAAQAAIGPEELRAAGSGFAAALREALASG